jgi:nitrite reductase (NO-forming)
LARAGAERQVVALAVGLAAVFGLLAAASVALPATARLGAWLPIHLLFAGSASTAIAGLMPFFSVALSTARPVHVAVRLAAVILVAAGALIVVAARFAASALTGPDALPAGVGGLVYMAGLILVGWATLAPLGTALGSRRLLIGAIYGVAAADVLAGAGLATLLLLGYPPAVQEWAALKPAHAWLNLFGFVSLTICGSLLHLLPTVAGARIRRSAASVASFAGVAGGPPLVALGFAAGSQVVALAGAAILVIGALALVIHASQVWLSRAHWTTDRGWHRLTTGSLIAAIAWFLGGTALAGAQVATGWSSGAAWQLGPVIAPIGAGWVAQALIGASAHLLPAVGSGSPERHARQRQILGRGGPLRLVLFNAGLIAAALGDGLTLFGMAAVAVAAIAAILLLGVALLATDPGHRLGSAHD